MNFTYVINARSLTTRCTSTLPTQSLQSNGHTIIITDVQGYKNRRKRIGSGPETSEKAGTTPDL